MAEGSRDDEMGARRGGGKVGVVVVKRRRAHRQVIHFLHPSFAASMI